MISSDDLAFPILLHSRKFWIFDLFETKSALIWEKGSLKRLDGLKGVSVIDDALQEFRILSTEVVRGHGFLSGYYLRGPFVHRNVVFRTKLAPVGKCDLRAVAELIAAFMKEAEGLRMDDLRRFWTAFEGFVPTANPTLSTLWSLYTSFKWGDEIETDE
jgi:hypothetical protein